MVKISKLIILPWIGTRMVLVEAKSLSIFSLFNQGVDKMSNLLDVFNPENPIFGDQEPVEVEILGPDYLEMFGGQRD